MLHVLLTIILVYKKNAQLSYLNRLRPQLPPQTSKTTATKETFTENAEPQQKQLDLITEDEEVPLERDEGEILEEKNDSQTESILRQLQILEDKKFLLEQTPYLKSYKTHKE